MKSLPFPLRNEITSGEVFAYILPKSLSAVDGCAFAAMHRFAGFG